jgi:hypothetical protein
MEDDAPSPKSQEYEAIGEPLPPEEFEKAIPSPTHVGDAEKLTEGCANA